MSITATKVLGQPVIIEPPAIERRQKKWQQQRGIFLPTTLSLVEKMEEEIGVDFVEAKPESGPPNTIVLRRGVHHTLLTYIGLHDDGYKFAGRILYTERKVISHREREAEKYIASLESAGFSLS